MVCKYASLSLGPQHSLKKLSPAACQRSRDQVETRGSLELADHFLRKILHVSVDIVCMHIQTYMHTYEHSTHTFNLTDFVSIPTWFICPPLGYGKKFLDLLSHQSIRAKILTPKPITKVPVFPKEGFKTQ